MYQCSDIVVDNSHRQNAPDAQEQHDSILATSSQFFFVDPAGHTQEGFIGEFLVLTGT